MVPTSEKASAVIAIDANQRPITQEEIDGCVGSPSVASVPIGEAKSSGIPFPGAAVSRTPDNRSIVKRPRALRIGDKVRSLVDDVCVSVGLTGLVVNVAPPRYGAPARARINWDNSTQSMADASTFELLATRESSEGEAE